MIRAATPEDFKALGFDTSKEPYSKSGVTVYKNYCRDNTGKYKGFTSKDLGLILTIDDLNLAMESIDD
tara:strand:+ start:1507 stop:1710 length:204 start_codon:yes stop_codon:yes gene_type:complete